MISMTPCTPSACISKTRHSYFAVIVHQGIYADVAISPIHKKFSPQIKSFGVWPFGRIIHGVDKILNIQICSILANDNMCFTGFLNNISAYLHKVTQNISWTYISMCMYCRLYKFTCVHLHVQLSQGFTTSLTVSVNCRHGESNQIKSNQFYLSITHLQHWQ